MGRLEGEAWRVEKWKAKRDFADADDLFKRKKYNEALEILNRLNREFPNNRRVMMPRALCLAEMGRYHEAATICETLLVEEEYPRARHLLNKLEPYLKNPYAPVHEQPSAFEQLETTAGTSPDMSAFGDERPVYLPPMDEGGGWGKPILLTLAIVLLAAAVGGAAFYYVIHEGLGAKQVAEVAPAEVEVSPAPMEPAPVEEEPYVPDFSQYNKYADPASVAQVQQQMAEQQPPPPAPFPGGRRELGEDAWDDGSEEGDFYEDGSATDVEVEGVDISDEGLMGLGIGLLAILFVVFSVMEFVVLFCTLLLLNKMPRPTLGENVLLIAGVAVASILISRIPYVGWFASIFMIITVFQLTFVDCLVMVLVNAVVWVAAAFVVVGLIGLNLGLFF